MKRLDAFHQQVLGEPVQRTRGEPAGIYRSAFLKERAELLVDRHVTRERLVADLWKATRTGRHQHARSVEDERGVETLALHAGCCQQVDQADRALVGDRV